MKAYPARVREWLKANPGWHSPKAIIDALGVPAGQTARRPYYSALKNMTDSGNVNRQGSGRSTAYEFVCDPPLRELNTTPEYLAVCREKKRKYMAARNLAKGVRTLAQRRIDDALRRAARLERLEQEKQERAAARLVRKAVNEDRRRAQATRVERKAKNTARAVIAVRRTPAASTAKPAPPPAQSVEEFIRAGGQVMRLPGIEQYIPDRSRA
ncbi:hypothetical protein FHR51_002542 [Xanthomonas arboricola]|uniref:hypothetical protein n=1 Tax=Xanthomonas cannabis TaxID=1885674 RepID=UPI0016163E5A|nr:hypothetical protein [Xanthomonas cannabis]MBB3806390.1 hypothetical protein [Xanthomonas cannabis]